MIELTDTNSSKIAAEFIRSRTRAGSPAMGMVMTLIIVAPEEDAAEAMAAAKRASREHPSRVLGVILGDARGAAHVNAQVGSGDGWGGEIAVIRLKGEVVRHAESVVLPLLLPDSPVAIWWPTDRAGRPCSRPARRPGPAADHRLRGRPARQVDRDADPVPHLRTRQHRPELDPADAVARAARRGPRPAPAQGHRRQGHRRADQPQRRPARGLAQRPAQGRRRPRQLRRPRHHRGLHGHQGGPDPHLARRRPAGDASPPPTGPTGRSRSSAARCRHCWRRSCAASTRTTSTPRPPPAWSS